MAAPLLQYGLFDRRVEREAAVQRELLDRALALSNERLLDLTSRRRVTAGGARAAFSLFMW
jgi:hypothetical protein